MHEPYTHLTGLTLVDLEDLLEDIRIYMQLEKEVRKGKFSFSDCCVLKCVPHLLVQKLIAFEHIRYLLVILKFF